MAHTIIFLCDYDALNGMLKRKEIIDDALKI